MVRRTLVCAVACTTTASRRIKITEPIITARHQNSSRRHGGRWRANLFVNSALQIGEARDELRITPRDALQLCLGLVSSGRKLRSVATADGAETLIEGMNFFMRHARRLEYPDRFGEQECQLQVRLRITRQMIIGDVPSPREWNGSGSVSPRA